MKWKLFKYNIFSIKQYTNNIQKRNSFINFNIQTFFKKTNILSKKDYYSKQIIY